MGISLCFDDVRLDFPPDLKAMSKPSVSTSFSLLFLFFMVTYAEDGLNYYNDLCLLDVLITLNDSTILVLETRELLKDK